MEARVQRDYVSAEGVYRANLTEQDRLYALGGASQASSKLGLTASGRYLALVTKSLQTLKRNNWRTVGKTTIEGISRTGWSASAVKLTSCEDSSRVRIVNSSGDDVTPEGDRRFVQTVTIEKQGTMWKVADVHTVRVSSFDDQAFCG